MKARVLTALVLIPVVLAAVFCASPWPVAVLSGVVLTLALKELESLLGTSVWPFAAVEYGGIGLYFLWPGRDHNALRAVMPTYLLVATSIGAFVAWRKIGRPVAGANQLIILFIAGLWLGSPLMALLVLHQTAKVEPWNLYSPILLILLPLWAGDTAAIFAGKAFGKHLLAPSISPKKTVEGGIANLVFSVLVGVGTAVVIDRSPWLGLACGVAVGVFGQLGDLFESALKRKADVKDSGSLLPGHGGILDRIDSLLFAAPVVALVIQVWPKR